MSRLTGMCSTCGQIFYVDQGHACPGPRHVLLLAPLNDFGHRGVGSTSAASETSPAWKAGPMAHHAPFSGRALARRALRTRRDRRLDELEAGVDALDRGVIEAAAMAGQAVVSTASLVRYMREQAALAGLPGPDASAPVPQPPSEAQARELAGMAAGHPESLGAELPEADEEMLGAYCAELWPDDVTAEGDAL